MQRRRFLLDGNIYDLLDLEPTVREQIRALIQMSSVEIVASPVLVAELRRSPFGGIPDWFAVSVNPEAIAISGRARSGMARSSTGEMYKQHLGESRKSRDAILAHSAHSMRATLVSRDRRCRERLKLLAGAGSALTYEEFKVWLNGAIGTHL
jgi:predicted nucleic acid-binding protein